MLLCPCLFHQSDNVWRSRRADTPRCEHFSTDISPSWITEQISVGKCAHWGASACRERQTRFKIVTWTKQTWTKHHNTDMSFVSALLSFSFFPQYVCSLSIPPQCRYLIVFRVCVWALYSQLSWSMLSLITPSGEWVAAPPLPSHFAS